MKNKFFFGFIAITTIASAIAHYWIPSIGVKFAMTSLAIIALAALLGKATETVAHYAGDRIGGFLNATFGNAAELIIAIFLIKRGMFDIVKASITGSIIGNLLLVLGLSLLAGGLKYKQQTFNPLLARQNASMMLLGVIALFVPAAFSNGLEVKQIHTFSLIVSASLILAYLLWLVFSMITHKEELENTDDEEDCEQPPSWSMRTAIIIMIVATTLVAVESEWLVQSVEKVAHKLGWSDLFIGAFVIAIVGNAAEHSAAIFMALKNKIGTSVEIAVGSSLQIALFVGPLIVFISYLFGTPMDIVFTTHELVAIGVGTFIAVSISSDGQTNWFEGILLLVVYMILGAGFYFV
ncbi:calcium/proton exchanger [Ammoniphilus oxalaticus]|uniref:Ca(2+)/H(+) antiporter n=1 Tax=Ammoniphilus oxalaticus TaxID=66863 RepID=A0A419SK31_9BACL|nr:calcium/proton exchanger [Ammoniphilus oxalaticus]RKD24337.1 calcium/proton exchanger [Ammoniphilus oxalaticus]